MSWILSQREIEREEGEGGNEGGSRGAQGHQPSVTVESYFFPWPSAVDSELNTECAHCRARGQTQPPERERRPEELADCRAGLKARSGADDALTSSQIKNPPEEQVKQRNTSTGGRGHLFIHLLHCDDVRLLEFDS